MPDETPPGQLSLFAPGTRFDEPAASPAKKKAASGSKAAVGPGSAAASPPADAKPRKSFVVFDLETKKSFEEVGGRANLAKLEVSVVDIDLREAMTERLEIPIAGDRPAPHARRGRVTLPDGATIREQPAASSPSIARVADGPISVMAEAELDGFVRVQIGESRPGWVAASDIGDAQPNRRARLVDQLDHMPPELTLATPNLVTRDVALRIRGTARDESRVRDVYIYVGARKEHYQSNRDGDNPREAAIDATVHLLPGINYVVVVARENDQSITRQAFVVRRDGPEGELLATPTHSEEWFNMGVDEE
jgi:carboxyl-terminal processing protease